MHLLTDLQYLVGLIWRGGGGGGGGAEECDGNDLEPPDDLGHLTAYVTYIIPYTL